MATSWLHPAHFLHGLLEAQPGGGVDDARVPAHWLMARLGKRVLRPGGIETTRWLLDEAEIGRGDDVIELAPGMGATARLVMERRPKSYVGVDRDAAAAERVGRLVSRKSPRARAVVGEASKAPLDDEVASIVVGEAMLSMQPQAAQEAIAREALRLLRPGGRYAIHELAIVPDDLDAERRAALTRDLSRTIHVGVRAHTTSEWRELLEDAGFVVEKTQLAPMRLLELDRLVADEGYLRLAWFACNVLRSPTARRRLTAVRNAFRAHAGELAGIGIVARKKG